MTTELPPETAWYAGSFHLEAVRDGLIPPTHGHQVHALFLDIVRSIAPDLAQALHELDGRKPFTVAPLDGLRSSGLEGHPVSKGDRLSLRVTMLDAALFSAVLAALVSGRRDARVGSLPFTVSALATTADQVARAGMMTPARLLDQAARHREFSFRLHTPTAFSLGTHPTMGRRMELLPRPELLFSSLHASWRAFGGPALPDGVRGLLEQTVVSRFDMATRVYRFRSNLQLGAVGAVAYEVRGDAEPEALRALNALADAATFLGVGYRTTMGMGQVQRIIPAQRPARDFP